MTTSTTKILGNITIQPDGTVLVAETITLTDGDTTATMSATYTYAPGDSVTASNYDRVKTICAAVWTDAVVAAYKAAHPATTAS